MLGSQTQDLRPSVPITNLTVPLQRNTSSLTRLPTHSSDGHLTKLLYSKFIIKGVKPFNHEAIVQNLKNSLKPQIKSSLINSNRQSKDRETLMIVNSTTQPDAAVIDRSKSSRVQSAFKRSQSTKIFARPQSAVQFLNKQISMHHSEYNNFAERGASSERKNRPTTATTRVSIDNRTKFQYVSDKNTALLKISDEQLTLIPVNHIQRNKREVSTKINNKKSFYLTASPNDQLTIRGQHQKKGVQEQNQQTKLMKQFKQQRVTVQERQSIKQRQQNYLNYMKQNMPYEYACLINQSNSQKQNQQLVNFGIDSQYSQESRKNSEIMEIEQYRQDYYNACVDTQYAMRRALRKKQSPLIVKCNNIDINQQQTLMGLYEKLMQRRQDGLDTTDINMKIKAIIQNLSFFKELQTDMLKTIFEIKYSLMQVEQDQIVIHQNSQSSLFYVIIYGSVVRRSPPNETRQLLMQNQSAPFLQSTLFDGQTFGLPLNAAQTTIQYSIKALQTCILMTFPINSYKKALTDSQNTEDRVYLLDLILNSVKGGGKFKKEELLTIANKLQSKVYSAQQIVVREGYQFNELMIVASGRVQICFECILTRKKQHKGQGKRNLHELQPMSLQQLRRKDLKDYELLQQNQQQIQYYYHRVKQERQRGEAINWRGFYLGLRGKNTLANSAIRYSIMSSHSNTRLFFLSPDKLTAFSNELQECIFKIAQLNYGQENICREEGELRQWQQFKQSLVRQILKSKGK